MASNYYPPKFSSKQFHCPHCGVFAKQKWPLVYINSHAQNNLKSSQCDHCDNYSFWFNERLTIPDVKTCPPINEFAPESIIADYNEAANILNKSPRGAAALLRLALQKLLKELGELGENINDDIKSLVKKGLPNEIQQALDIVRVIGNESVHPGQIDLNDNRNTADQLFILINFIIEDRIERPKKIQDLYEKLPENKRLAIAKRDS